MQAAVATIPGAVVAGRLLRWRQRFGSFRFRWPLLGAAGVVLGVAPKSGPAGAVLLAASFALLVAFAFINVRRPGFRLVLIGLALNLLVIGANHGMPVSREAVIASGQRAALPALSRQPGGEHHLATSRDAFLPLADVIPMGPPVGLVVSVGDLLTCAGAIWFVVGAMRSRNPANLV